MALCGDKGYRANWIDEYLLSLCIKSVIPSKENETRAEREVHFDKTSYRQGNIIERLIGWLKESRRILSRFEITAKVFGGMAKLAFIRKYLLHGLIKAVLRQSLGNSTNTLVGKARRLIQIEKQATIHRCEDRFVMFSILRGVPPAVWKPLAVVS